MYATSTDGACCGFDADTDRLRYSYAVFILDSSKVVNASDRNAYKSLLRTIERQFAYGTLQATCNYPETL